VTALPFEPYPNLTAIANKKLSMIIYIMIAEKITASIYNLKTCIFIEVAGLRTSVNNKNPNAYLNRREAQRL